MMNRLQGSVQPMAFVPQQPRLKVLFGHTTPYEPAISVSISNQPLSQVNPVAQPQQANLFIRSAEEVAQVFSDATSYASKFIAKLLKAQQSASDGENNVFSTLSPKAEGQEDSSAARALRLGTAFQQALSHLPQDARELKISLPPSLTGKDAVAAARELAIQSSLQAYNPYFRRTTAPRPFNLQSVGLSNLPPTAETLAAVHEGSVIGQGMNLTRYMVDAPPNIKSPLWLSQVAKSLETQSKHGTMRVDVMQRADLEAEKMGMALSVAAGNQTNDADQIRMPVMVYTPKDGKYDKTILLVGKGIMFDTGGSNMKSSLYIHGMHGDMAGAAAVVGTMKAIDDLQLPNVRIIGVTPFTPNRIGANATLPHTVVNARNGKSVEVSNTDAEGRLILGDAIHYAGEKYNPDLIVDIATLTGGKVAALGGENAVAVMGNNLDLTKKVHEIEAKSLGRVSEAVELTEAHRKWVTKGGKGKSDVYNSHDKEAATLYEVCGKGVKYVPEKHGIHHSAQGGAFIREFLPNPKTPWVHLDMAGAEFAKVKHLGNDEEYATGFGVQDLFSIVKAATEGDLLKFRRGKKLQAPSALQ